MKIVNTYDFLSLVMYPTLRNRREFVHDCWTISKAAENEELKMLVSEDPFFWVARNDLLTLLQTKDDKIITHLME